MKATPIKTPEDLRAKFESTGKRTLTDGHEFTADYTEWLEKKVLAKEKYANQSHSKLSKGQTPEEIIEDFLRAEASEFPAATEEETLYRFRNHILFIEEEKLPSVTPLTDDQIRELAEKLAEEFPITFFKSNIAERAVNFCVSHLLSLPIQKDTIDKMYDDFTKMLKSFTEEDLQKWIEFDEKRLSQEGKEESPIFQAWKGSRLNPENKEEPKPKEVTDEIILKTACKEYPKWFTDPEDAIQAKAFKKGMETMRDLLTK